MNLLVLHRDAFEAHPAGHLHAFKDAAWRGCTTDGAGFAVVALSTVAGVTTTETVAFHNTGGSLTFAPTADVHGIASAESISFQLLAELELSSVWGANFNEMTARCYTGLLKVAFEWLGDLAGVNRAVSELHRGVTVGLVVTHLRDDVGAHFDNGDRQYTARVIPYLGHAEFGAQQGYHRLCLRSHLLKSSRI